jgi:hypothetical protein
MVRLLSSPTAVSKGSDGSRPSENRLKAGGRYLFIRRCQQVWIIDHRIVMPVAILDHLDLDGFHDLP